MEKASQSAPSTSFDVFLSEVKRRKQGETTAESVEPAQNLSQAEETVIRLLASHQPELAEEARKRSHLPFFEFTEAIDGLVRRGLILRVGEDRIQLTDVGAAALH